MPVIAYTDGPIFAGRDAKLQDAIYVAGKEGNGARARRLGQRLTRRLAAEQIEPAPSLSDRLQRYKGQKRPSFFLVERL